MLARCCGFDEFLGPGDRLVLFHPGAKERGVNRYGGGSVEVVVVGGPAKCGAKIRRLQCEPFVGLTLSLTVSQGHHVRFLLGEVAGMGGAGLVGIAVLDELLLCELPDGFQHRIARPRR